MYVCMYVCMYVRMYACMHVCMYAGMYMILTISYGCVFLRPTPSVAAGEKTQEMTFDYIGAKQIKHVS